MSEGYKSSLKKHGVREKIPARRTFSGFAYETYCGKIIYDRDRVAEGKGVMNCLRCKNKLEKENVRTAGEGSRLKVEKGNNDNRSRR